MGTLPFLPVSMAGFSTDADNAYNAEEITGNMAAELLPGTAGKSIIGQYGSWAASLVGDPAPLSFRHDDWSDLDQWKVTAGRKLLESVAPPPAGAVPEVTVERQYNYDGLEIEELSWHLPYGRSTKAILLKPQGANGPLPAILGLHDHGGNKYLGKRKITRVSADTPGFVLDHQEKSYEGLAWANEAARRGYVVLVHDTFAFASRRILYGDIDGIEWGPCNVDGKSDADPENPANIALYNTWAGEHENIMSKTLFCAGTTWPGVFLAEDMKAVDILCNRKDVDAARIGCGGLSGGGLRTVYLGGADPRIKCAVCVGFMSTWNDFLLNKSYTHTWMTYTPLLPRYMDFPEILGIRAPLPTLVLNNSDDDLYTLPEMQRADRILKEVYTKAGANGRYNARFYPGPHKFDRQMQQDAFAWFDRWLQV